MSLARPSLQPHWVWLLHQRARWVRSLFAAPTPCRGGSPGGLRAGGFPAQHWGSPSSDHPSVSPSPFRNQGGVESSLQSMSSWGRWLLAMSGAKKGASPSLLIVEEEEGNIRWNFVSTLTQPNLRRQEKWCIHKQCQALRAGQKTRLLSQENRKGHQTSGVRARCRPAGKEHERGCSRGREGSSISHNPCPGHEPLLRLEGRAAKPPSLCKRLLSWCG